VLYDSLLSWHIGEYDLLSDFSYSQPSGYTIQFTSQSRNEIGQLWDFGADIDTTANPSFTFPGSGTYPVQLTSFNLCDTIVSNQEISVSSILPSIEGIDMPAKPIIYPNPAIDKVFLNLKSTIGISINIYSLFGGNVITIDDLSSIEIDISSLKNGLYFLKILKGKETITKKLVIQK
jgi:PKD repeat protein